MDGARGMGTFEMIEVEDWSTSELKEIQPFFIDSYYRSTVKDSFNTLAEAEAEALVRTKKNPWGAEWYVMEVRKHIKTSPAGEINIQIADIQQYIEQKETQDKQ